MPWRKWIVRGIVYGITGAAALGAFLYQRWTNPAAVREQIMLHLREVFPGAHVSVDSARLRILGGIQLNGLRLLRDDDPEKHEFLHVPSAIFYHDKEKILEGELTLRKIELLRPRLRIRRERDGSWNLKGIVRPPDEGRPQTLMPVIVIHRGTLILEDRSDPLKPATIEVDDISLSVINDPLPTVTVRGAANSDLLGKLQFTGRVQRQDSEAHLSFKALNLPLTHGLVSRFPALCPPHVAAGLQLNALTNVQGQITYHPKNPQPLYYDLHADVSNGSVQHPHLPLPLEQLFAKLHCSNGELHLEKLTAKSGATDVEATGVGLLSDIEKNFEVDVDLKHLMLGDELASRLPDKIRELHKMFQPNGPTTIHINCARENGEWAPLSSGKNSTVSLKPEGIKMEFVGFKYPLERAEGAIDYDIKRKNVAIKMFAFSGPCPIRMNGHWEGSGEDLKVDLTIETTDWLPINETLIKALPGTMPDFVRSFHPEGKMTVKSHFKHEVGAADFSNEHHILFKDASICWDQLPCALTQVSGGLDIDMNGWHFRGFEGMHRNGKIEIAGKSVARGREQDTFGIALEIKGNQLLLDDEIRDALRRMPGLQKAWETFNPTGRITFRASIDRPSADIHDLDVHVEAHGASVKPIFFPLPIDDVSGVFRFHHNRLTVTRLRAHHERTKLLAETGTVDLHPRGGYYANFPELHIQDLRLDAEFIKALPDKLRDTARNLHLADPLRVKTRVVIAQPPETGRPPDLFWDSQVWMHKAKFTTGLEFSDVTGTIACTGRHNGRQLIGLVGNTLLDEATIYGQPFKKVHTKFQMRDNTSDVLVLGLHAPIFGGDVTGQIRVNFNSSLDYEVNLTASQINVAEFGRHNIGPKSQLTGVASGRLHLKGLSSGIDSLDGNGSIDIPQGHFLNLPFVLDLLRFLGLRGPDRTVFEEFHTDFSIQGPQVSFQKVDLLGSAISLSGKGEYDLQSRKVKLDVYPMWGRIEQLLPTQVRPLPTTISKNLLTVEVRGKLGSDAKDLKYTAKPMPIVLDPLLLVRDLMMGRPNGLANEPAPVMPAMPTMPALPTIAPIRPNWMRLGQ